MSHVTHALFVPALIYLRSQMLTARQFFVEQELRSLVYFAKIKVESLTLIQIIFGSRSLQVSMLGR